MLQREIAEGIKSSLDNIFCHWCKCGMRWINTKETEIPPPDESHFPMAMGRDSSS